LQEVTVRETVVTEPLGDVGGEANVGAGEPMLVVNVTVAESADGNYVAAFIGAMLADKLGHRPRLERRADSPQVREVAEQYANQFAFAVPETGK
jgi:hypothetical protein